ncbi:hypothetical protein POM88_004774 [Heracleum sosnowskyi]|uniref:TF-B3 domain-containing protein n=1 Tax=Heracleum sosnowskyi TaxID=360622 RepID=A0AAD8NCV0_9APIA|nr:hypothetical protein POM88_004774 [Heracleum sosnowskyi]
MKKRNVRDLTGKDMEGSQQKPCEMSEFDKLVEVCRVACELYDQKNPNNFTISEILSSDKSSGKKPVSAHQETNKVSVFSSTTCRISADELLKGGGKKSKGETSMSSRYDEIVYVRRLLPDHDDQVVVTEEVLGNKRKCFDSKDGDFEYGDQVVKEKDLGKKRKCCDIKEEDSEYSETKEKKPRGNNRAREVVETAPLPVRFANEIRRLGGNDVRLLIQKNLYTTDLNPKQNRLNIPINQLREESQDFLTEAEKKKLDKRDANGKIVQSMLVPLLEPNLNRSNIKFKKWISNKSFWYVLCGPWTVMHTNNHLEVGTDLQVWSFRVNGDLNLALVSVPLPVPGMQQ